MDYINIKIECLCKETNNNNQQSNNQQSNNNNIQDGKNLRLRISVSNRKRNKLY